MINWLGSIGYLAIIVFIVYRGISEIREVRDKEFKKAQLELYRLIHELTIADLMDDMLFTRLLNQSVSVLNIPNSDIAKEFSASLPAIVRWRNGAVRPHPAMRRPIYKWLVDLAQKRLDTLAQPS